MRKSEEINCKLVDECASPSGNGTAILTSVRRALARKTNAATTGT